MTEEELKKISELLKFYLKKYFAILKIINEKIFSNKKDHSFNTGNQNIKKILQHITKTLIDLELKSIFMLIDYDASFLIDFYHFDNFLILGKQFQPFFLDLYYLNLYLLIETKDVNFVNKVFKSFYNELNKTIDKTEINNEEYVASSSTKLNKK